MFTMIIQVNNIDMSRILTTLFIQFSTFDNLEMM